MATKVTKESLAEKITDFEERKKRGLLSINGRYQLEAYRLLLSLLQPVQLPRGFSVGDNEDDPSYFNDWCYLAKEVQEELTKHGLGWEE